MAVKFLNSCHDKALVPDRMIWLGRSGRAYARVSDLLGRRRPICRVGDEGSRRTAETGTKRENSVASSWP